MPILPRRTRWRLGAIALLACAAIATWSFFHLGHFLHHEDPLEHADAIFVLGGSRLSRAAEAADLVREGWAPRVFLPAQREERAIEDTFSDRGIRLPPPADVQVQLLVQLGVSADAIEIVDAGLVSTADEAEYLRTLVQARGWTRVIVVTSKLHTARTALVMRRRLAGTGVGVTVRATRYDRADVDRWWARRADLLFSILESQKMLVYWVGIAD